MSTNSRIAIQTKDDIVRSIYCHWDGYPEGVGAILLEHYQNDEKIIELINLGSISSLHENIKPQNPEKHSFDNREPECTVAYHRDRGEDLEIDEYKSVSEWSIYKLREEWNYIWKDGAWYVNGSKHKPILRLTKLSKKHYKYY